MKILDFGLAKLTQVRSRGSHAQLAALDRHRRGESGRHGRSYMAPEQVRGKPADARSDIFAFGAVLYEMLSGRRAFARGETTADTLTAILDEGPRRICRGRGVGVPASLERIVRRCLEKDPEDRFQSARDVAFALEALSSATGRIPEALLPAPSRSRWLKPILLGLLVAAASGAAGLWYGKHSGVPAFAVLRDS